MGRLLAIAMTFTSLFSCAMTGMTAEYPSCSFSNYLRYGTGKETLYDYSRDKRYLEEEAEMRLSWERTIAGLRYDYDNPAEFTPDRNIIRKYYLDHRMGGLSLRLGTFSDLFGRGMAFNTYEEKTIGHDSELSGLRLNWITDDTSVHIVGGRLAYEQIPDFVSLIDLDMGGISAQRRVKGKFFLGGSFVRSKISQTPGYFRDVFFMNIAEITGEYKGEGTQFFTSFTSNENGSNRLFKKGNISSYLGINLSKGPLGMTVEYKNYRFGIAPPNLSRQSFRHRRFMPFQNPPSVLREHGWVFLSRRSNGVDFNDEVGALINAYYAADPGTTINLSGSLASKHYAYEKISSAKFRRMDNGQSWIPSIRKECSPYWQVYGDIEHFFGNGSSINTGVAYTYENNYNDYHPEQEEIIRMAAVPLHLMIVLSPVYSLQWSAEYQYFKETQDARAWYNDGIFTLGLLRSPSVNLSITAELLDGNAAFSEKKSWVYGSISFRFRSKQIAEFGYGETRGGMSCTNGLCRYVEPFRGFRLTATFNL